MVTRRRSPRSPAPRRSAPRPKTQWESLAFSNALSAAANIVANDLTPEPIQTITGDVGTAVLRRSIMHFDINSTINESSVLFVSFGIYVAGHEGFDQLAVNDPEGDFFQGWLYWTRRSINPSTTGSSRKVSWDADIRSMRRLRGGYKLVAVTSHPVQAISLSLDWSARFLWSVQA